MDVARKTENAGSYRIGSYPRVSEHDAGRTHDVSIYEDQIPEFVAGALENLYESVYCTLARFKIYGEADGASTYVVRARGNIICVILFRIEGNTAKVINQQIQIGQDELIRFARTIFAKYRKVRVILLYAIDTNIERFPFLFQKFAALEENVVSLPASGAEYLASISQNLLKRIRSGERKLEREHPQSRFEVLSGPAVSEQVLRDIVALAGARMASKQQSAYLGEEQIGKILRLIHEYGHVGVLIIDGVIRAGNIFYGVGTRYFMHVIAHDPEYDKYMLGHIVQYKAACHCIEQGGRECWLMGGGRENKARFGAFPAYFDSIDIYRSRFHLLLGLRRLCSGTARKVLHGAKVNLSRLGRAGHRSGRIAATGLALARAVRQGWRRTAGKPK
jgi:hypothetical protein